MNARLILITLAVPLLAGCSLGSSRSLSLGYADDAPQPSRGASVFSSGFAAPKAVTPKQQAQARPRTETKVAALDQGTRPDTYAKAPKGALADRDYSDALLDKQAALKMVNAYRREKGLRALRLDPKLEQAAEMHSRDLAKWDRISHYGSDGSNPWDRVKRAGFKARLAAENVGTGQATLDEVFVGWKQSPGHNKNLLLADATHMGIALVKDPNTEFKTFWTLVLGSPL